MEGLFLGMIVTILLSKESERLGLISAAEHKANIETISKVVEKLGADDVREKPNGTFGCNCVNAERRSGDDTGRSD